MSGYRTSSEDGAMAVEFGLMFPVVALLIAGSIWFGVMFSSQLSLTQAAREAVRTYALTGDTAQTINTAQATYGAGSLTPGDIDFIEMCDPLDPGTPPGNAVVGLTTEFEFLFNLPPFDEGVTLNAQAVMRCGG